MTMIPSKDNYIDLLRFVGITLIILAHVYPPNILFQLRTFDVPLMIFVSGLSYSNKKIDKFWTFIFKRIKRLLIPVYLFLSIYFVIVFILKYFNIDFGVATKHVIGSYLLLDGIGYVWIIRIFLIIALLTPVFIYVNKKITSNILFFILIISGILLYESVIQNHIGVNFNFVKNYVYEGIGYSFLFLIGLRIKNMSYLSLKKLLSAICVIFICSIIYFYRSGFAGIIPFQSYKYPPHAYYILYGIFMSIFLWTFKFNISPKIVTQIYNKVSFVGSNSIWIYLYHIPLIQITAKFVDIWYLKYLIVYSLSISICYQQIHLAKIGETKFKNNSFLSYFKG